MSGYTPVFGSVFTGTLFGRYPDLPLWLVLLAMADKSGIVDAHPSYISAACGISQGDVEDCLRRFCQPDPHSRTPDEDGRRLQPLEGRGFGWRIVNHGKYREKARKMSYDQARIEDGRNADRMRTRRDPTRPDATRADPPSYSDANTDKDKNLPSVGMRKRATPRKRCPDDWTPTPEQEAAIRTECPDVDLLAEGRKFRDHEFARGRSDWPATWRNWMREAQARAASRPKPVQPVKRAPPTDEQITAERAKAAADNRRRLESLGLAALKAVPQ